MNAKAKEARVRSGRGDCVRSLEQLRHGDPFDIPVPSLAIQLREGPLGRRDHVGFNTAPYGRKPSSGRYEFYGRPGLCRISTVALWGGLTGALERDAL